MHKNLEHLLRKQYVYGYMVFFNMNICRNNTEDIRTLTEYAHDHRIATDYHINETPMLEQDEHFKHLSDNLTYIRPEDWPEIDSLVDWLIEKNKSGHQMVNSVQRLQEIKAFVRMASGADLGNATNDKAVTANNNFYFSDTLALARGSTISGWERRFSVSNSIQEWISRTDSSSSFPFPIFCPVCLQDG